ncbi:MAG TPA: hypothetical protein PLE30_06430 [Candidatus Kapabacteria bacterium]|nr:hypothetical protein [Candidatus Kapabacteria bacterium]
MDRNKVYSLIVVFIFFIATLSSYSIDFKNKQKAFFGDVGIGSPGLSIGAGYRYWFLGLNVSLGGFLNSIPGYNHSIPNGIKINRNEPLPNGFREDKYTSTLMCIDVNGYYEQFLPVILTASIGYYSQTDTVTAFQLSTGNRYLYKAETNSGLSFGIGAEYQINDIISAGAMFHTRRGILIRMTYYLYDE